ncbi:hypothetical protein NUW58_g10456 [Xylaria curta]|uniref:Uncharacterized protein n=1 Tax=Xylaria curta TaxID=42375 RepID=A0ACC1ML65_9PEZI|nr:hypothetical protein NUW58_g10456 [Xylaria curta]
MVQAAGNDGYVTSTITNTETYTVTACAVNVPNCPAGYQTSVTLIHTTSFTTICPATATGSVTIAPTLTPTGGHGIETITKHVTTMVPYIQLVFLPRRLANILAVSLLAIQSPLTLVHCPRTLPAAPLPAYPASNSIPTYPIATPSVGSSSASYPLGGSSISGYPTPIPYPSGPAPPSGGNGTVPQTWATYQPSPSVTGPAGYPTSPAGTPPATAGVGKVSSSIAAVVALMGAVMAL